MGLLTDKMLGVVTAAAAAVTFVVIVGDFLFGLRFLLLFVGIDFHPFGMTGGIAASFVAGIVLSFVSYLTWMATGLAGASAVWAGEAWWTER